MLEQLEWYSLAVSNRFYSRMSVKIPVFAERMRLRCHAVGTRQSVRHNRLRYYFVIQKGRVRARTCRINSVLTGPFLCTTTSRGF